MTLQEYYNFPEGANVNMTFFPHWLIDKPNFPLPSNCSYLFYKYGGSYLPPLDTSKVTDMSNMLDSSNINIDCIKDWDTSNATNMTYMFNGCSSLNSLDSIENWNVSKVTNMRYMFDGCSYLTSVDLTSWDTSKVANMGNMFDGTNLETLSAIDCSGISGTDNNGAGMFGYSGLSTLKNFGGWIGLKKSVTNYGINKCSNLTRESCINILNGLFNFTENQLTPSSSEGKLKVHANFLTAVGDDITIGTNKGWTITT